MTKSSKSNLADEMTRHVDIADLVAGLDGKTGELRESIRQRVHAAVSGASTGELLTLQVKTGGRTVVKAPEPTPDYVGSLIRYLRNDTSAGEISAEIERVILRATQEAATEFYKSAETVELLSKKLTEQVARNEEIQRLLAGEIEQNAAWLKRELKDVNLISGKSIAADRVLDAVSSAVSATLHTAGGAMIVGLLAKALALPAVKLAITKAIIVALGNAAFQKLLLIAMKKAGVGVLLHMALAKLVAGGATMSIGWIVAPIIAGILIYEYVTLPKKLADKLAPSVAEKLGGRAEELHREVAKTFAKEAMKVVGTVIGDEFESLRDQLMQPADGVPTGSTLHSPLFDSFIEARNRSRDG
jgi:hypothetical protein